MLNAIALAQGEGEARWWLGSLAIIKATAQSTGGQFTLVEVLEDEGETPLHVHHREDEAFWILEGRIEFVVGEKTVLAGPGDFLLAPRDVPHRYTVKHGPARMLFLFTPAGFEEMILATSDPATERRLPGPDEGVPDFDALPNVVQRYGCELLG